MGENGPQHHPGGIPAPGAPPAPQILVRLEANGSITIAVTPECMNDPTLYFGMIEMARLYMISQQLGHMETRGGSVLVAPAGAVPPLPPGFRG